MSFNQHTTGREVVAKCRERINGKTSTFFVPGLVVNFFVAAAN